jgi:8-hydroxy-5-deazaflavin:NADPH oxidoreductase
MEIGIIGTGNIGRALARTLVAAGYTVHVAGRDMDAAAALAAETGAVAATVAQAVERAGIVFLAVPYPAVAGLASEASFSGKIVVDPTNPVTEDFGGLRLGHSGSAGEATAAALAGSRVVKGFNTIFAEVYARGPLFGERRAPVFLASDDDAAKADVAAVAEAAGFEAVDAGRIRNARFLEPLGYLNIQFGYMLGRGLQIAPAWLAR